MKSRPIRMTTTRIASLTPGVYGDPGQVGLQLEVRPARGGFSRTWKLRFSFAGEKSTLTLGHFPAVGLEQARKLAQQYRDFAAQGIDPRKAKPRKRRSRVGDAVAAALTPAATVPIGDKHSIDFLVSEWLTKDVDVNRKRDKATGGKHYRGIMRRDVLPRWTGRDARSITDEECFALCDDVVARGSLMQANHTARALRKLFKFGKRRKIVEHNPAADLGTPGGESKQRDRNLVNNPAGLRAPARAASRVPHDRANARRDASTSNGATLAGTRPVALGLGRLRREDVDVPQPRLENAREYRTAIRRGDFPFPRTAQACARLGVRRAETVGPVDEQAAERIYAVDAPMREAYSQTRRRRLYPARLASHVSHGIGNARRAAARRARRYQPQEGNRNGRGLRSMDILA
jgi:Arm DNA-binding domain